ncbi:hypothetical protein [Sporosarcina aquimarina]|uniref:Uncharacterized protein n=1 Tax=Sporosarcina aquimarina TaxID=114975 RepID=A0ABU4FVF5_9BACL|nr:hypothetical protein [Sporosarcina aquimarina]MDW0108691.1 hypothetical protein [Sporosarcina aquimarina]
MKKWIIGVFLAILVLVGIVGIFLKGTTIESVYSTKDLKVDVNMPRFIELAYEKDVERKVENTHDLIHMYSVNRFGKKIGTYELTERTLGNGSQFLFERLTNDARLGVSLESVYHFGDSVKVKEYSWNPRKVDHPHHDTFGTDPTVNPYGKLTIDGNERIAEALVGYSFTSKELVKKYDVGESRIRELDKEVQDVTVTDDGFTRGAKAGGHQIAESWVMLADEPLFESEKEEDEFIDFALENQFSQLNWITMDGPYTKLPFSIDPGTKMGYGRVIGRMEDDVALDWYSKSESLYFETMVLNSRVNLLNYIDEFGGTRWPTEYTSTWLNNAYGIKAPYVDTRYNEYVAFFLDDTEKKLDDEVDKSKLYVPVYADYLLSRIEKGETIEAGDGFMIVDYFDEDPENDKPHASLNHELGGLKILLTAYRETEDAKYLDAAESVMKGIEAFGVDEGGWIRENNDLWYQARPDGTFSGDDYPQLTLVDLVETQSLLEEMDMERNPFFDKLIDAKLKFLEDSGEELIEKVTKHLKQG